LDLRKKITRSEEKEKEPDVRNKTLDVMEKRHVMKEEKLRMCRRKTTIRCKEEKPFRGCEKGGKEKA
jgi:hypothetical protein